MDSESVSSACSAGPGSSAEVVIWATKNSPASSRPSQAGMRSGGIAPAT